MESPVLDVIEGDFQDDHKRLFAKRFMLFSAENDTYRVREALNPVLEFADADGFFLAADKKVGNHELCSALEKTGFKAVSIDFASCDKELVRFAYDKGLCTNLIWQLWSVSWRRCILLTDSLPEEMFSSMCFRLMATSSR